MARIRTIKPEFWKSERLAARLPGPDGRQARMLFIGLWNFAQDHGVIQGRARYLLAEIFPNDEDITEADIARWLTMLEAGSFIVRYERDGFPYVWIRGFDEHQKINRPTAPTYPLPTDLGRSASPHGATHGAFSEPLTEETQTSEKIGAEAQGGLTEDSVSDSLREGIGREGKGVELTDDSVSAHGGLTESPGAESTDRGELKLETQTSAKRARKPSRQRVIADWFEEVRRDRLGDDWTPDKKLSEDRLNTELQGLKGVEESLLQRATELFFDDPRRASQDPPFCLLYFARDLPDYLSKAKRSLS